MCRIVLLLVLFLTAIPVLSLQKGGVEYIPAIDYSKIDTAEFEAKGLEYYKIAMTSSNEEEAQQNAENALGIYQALLSKHKDNTDYCLKIAELYDRLGKNRYAKEFYYRAIILSPDSAKPYEEFGNFYYTRQDYRRALKQYNEAYIRDKSVYNVSNKIGTIYQKLGDTKSALKYLNEAYELNPSDELSRKIRLLEELNSSNALYYQNTRIHFVGD